MSDIKVQKSLLAKLLASENIRVRHSRKNNTAAFNVENRTLVLPNWNDVSDALYNLLIAHEVGHALFSPPDSKSIVNAVKIIEPSTRKYDDIVQQYLNIVEDARIERLIHRKFPGSKQFFVVGYNELALKRNFFGKNRYSTMKFADRVNIFFKLGPESGIIFNDEELKIIGMINATNTYEDVIEVTKVLWAFCKHVHSQSSFGNNANPDEILNDIFDDTNSPDEDLDDEYEENIGGGSSCADDENVEDLQTGTDEDDSDNEEDSFAESDFSDASDSEEESEDTSGRDVPGGEGEDSTEESEDESNNSVNDFGDLESDTEKYFRNTINNLSSSSYGKDIAYYGIDEEAIRNYKKNYIIDYNSVHDIFNRHFESFRDNETFKNIEKDWNKFNNDMKNSANYFAKQFELKKAARNHKRSKINKTGVLDMNNLHKYRTHEDVFLSNKITKDGKKHGLIMYIDWSGSMCNNITETIKQTISLVMFAKRIGVPFDVYSFNNGSIGEKDRIMIDFQRKDVFAFKEDKINIGELDRLQHLVSSDMNRDEYNNALFNLFYIAENFGRCRLPSIFNLGGTPLNNVLLFSDLLINEFKKKHRIDVCNFIVLTDGQSNPLILARGGYSTQEKHIEFPEIGKTYLAGGSYQETRNLLDRIKIKTNCNIIGYYIMKKVNSKSLCRLARFYSAIMTNEEYDSISEKQLHDKKKSHFVEVKFESGYDSYFFIESTNVESMDEFVIDENNVKGKMTNGKIATQFAKYLDSKCVNKIFLSRFAECISAHM